jgi:hypothetical protein
LATLVLMVPWRFSRRLAQCGTLHGEAAGEALLGRHEVGAAFGRECAGDLGDERGAFRGGRPRRGRAPSATCLGPMEWENPLKKRSKDADIDW